MNEHSNLQQQPQQPIRIKLKLSDTTEVTCPCGGSTFDEGMLLRRVSRILSGGGPEITPIPAIYCVKCGKPVTELLPPELQPQINI